jgi:uncharacterized membrane protein
LTALAIVLCLVCQLFLLIGQLFLKRAMTPMADTPANPRLLAIRLIPGIACMTLWFFLWLGLLQSWELSRIFPFEGLNPALLVLAAWFFLKERVSVGAWIGIGLITVGIMLVA